MIIKMDDKFNSWLIIAALMLCAHIKTSVLKKQFEFNANCI